GARSVGNEFEGGFVVSHPFARKKAKGWGTGLLWGDCLLKDKSPLRDLRGINLRGLYGLPPFRQKEGERMGHGAFVGGIAS
ncbi:MAG: hypothetical protein ABSG62_24605, partial [Terracidiphilus sp.]